MEQDELLPEIPKDKKREAFYRRCIDEFERLGYSDQFIEDLNEESVRELMQLGLTR